MSLETARKAVHFVMDLTPREEAIDFCFFGGEPLLRFSLLKDIVSYANERLGEMQHPVRLNVTTNGTLVNDAVLEFFERERVYLFVSLDGPQAVHDRHRRYRDGRGTFSDVMTNLRRALWQRLLSRVRLTCDPGQPCVVFRGGHRRQSGVQRRKDRQ
jgi:uncharacterized protein